MVVAACEFFTKTILPGLVFKLLVCFVVGRSVGVSNGVVY